MTHPHVIQRIARTMVPVSLDYARLLDERSAEAKSLAPIFDQGIRKQGVWIISPDGLLLGQFESSVPEQCFESPRDDGRACGMVRKTQRQITLALQAFGPIRLRNVPPGQGDPSRGTGFLPDGGVCLAFEIRRRDPSHVKSPVIASAMLTRDEFACFALPVETNTQSWKVPEAAAKKLCRVLSPMCSRFAPQGDWVDEATLSVEIHRLHRRRAYLRYEGHLCGTQRLFGHGPALSNQQIELTGVGVYDLDLDQMESLLIVGTGSIRWVEAPETPVWFDALIEWRNSPKMDKP